MVDRAISTLARLAPRLREPKGRAALYQGLGLFVAVVFWNHNPVVSFAWIVPVSFDLLNLITGLALRWLTIGLASMAIEDIGRAIAARLLILLDTYVETTQRRVLRANKWAAHQHQNRLELEVMHHEFALEALQAELEGKGRKGAPAPAPCGPTEVG